MPTEEKVLLALFEAEYGRKPRSFAELNEWADKPITTTPEEEAENVLADLRMSEAMEWMNEHNPDLPPGPVPYPKAVRRRQ